VSFRQKSIFFYSRFLMSKKSKHKIIDLILSWREKSLEPTVVLLFSIRGDLIILELQNHDPNTDIISSSVQWPVNISFSSKL
jgi:5'-3' exonuclease